MKQFLYCLTNGPCVVVVAAAVVVVVVVVVILLVRFNLSLIFIDSKEDPYDIHKY